MNNFKFNLKLIIQKLWNRNDNTSRTVFSPPPEIYLLKRKNLSSYIFLRIFSPVIGPINPPNLYSSKFSN